ncbi:2,3-diaminopropionate biosynthesis protein SbnA [Streptomyces sp. NPDC057052]|uniref:2,3-diaminopropionate biosynthesis protein SbnA n=1 Tax=Streptomyces sp. NPDC057052 TaxID=3346010 RepID=UPI00364037EF
MYENAYEMIQDDVFLHLDGAAANIDLYLKIEGLNPAGSIKLKTARSMVEDAERRGFLSRGSRLIESSSGSLGIALAVVSAAKGYRFLCVTDPSTSALSVETMRALGAEVVTVNRPDEAGGYLGTRIAYIHEQLAGDPDLVWLNQYVNPANSAVHDRCTAAAISATIPDLDYLFVGTGTSGTLMGCIRHFRRESPGTRIIAVDAVGSVNFGGAAARRFIPGIGTSRRPEILRSELVDDMELVAETDTVRTCRWLARRYGFFAGGSTGSVVQAVLRRAPELPPGSSVVAVSPDLGDRYVQTIYNDDWVAETFGPECLEDSDDLLFELTRARN